MKATGTMTDAEIVDLIIGHEGDDYTNDPDDAGGPTKFGITLAELQAWRKRPTSARDVETLERSEATLIYIAKYLRPFDRVPAPLRINAIDFGVNAGVTRSAITLQEMVGATVDGQIGSLTVNALAVRTPDTWNVLFVGMRVAFYENLIRAKPTQVKYRNGWRNRALSFLPDQPAARKFARRRFPMGKAYVR